MGCTQSSPAPKASKPALKAELVPSKAVDDNFEVVVESRGNASTISTVSSTSTHSNKTRTNGFGSTKKRVEVRSTSIRGQKKSTQLSDVQEFIRHSKFFCHLSNSGFNAAEKELTVLRLEKGTTLIERNTISENLYILVSGEITLTLAASGDEKKAEPGEAIGQAGFYFNIRHTFDAKTTADSVVLVLSRKVFNANKKKDWLTVILESIKLHARNLVTQRLRTLDFAARLSEDRLWELGELCKVKTFTREETIFKEGESGEEFFVLVHGELVVTLNSTKGLEIIEIKRLGPGSSFGEISLLQKSKRSATVTAIMDSTLFSLSKQEFDRFLQMAPEVHEQMVHSIRERTQLKRLANNIPFVEFLGPNKLHLLSESAVPTFYAPGAKILKQGSRHPTMFFIIMTGTVDVIINNSKKKELHVGEYFGELSIVSDRPFSATIKAGSKGARCLTCTKHEFKTIFHDEVAVWAEIQIKVLGREAELKHLLHHPAGRKAFLKHCKKEWAQENISFFLGAEKIERMGQQIVKRDVLEALNFNVDEVIKQRQKELEDETKRLFDRYIDPNGKEPVNIKASCRNEIVDAIDAGNITYTLFTDAKQEIYKLLERDNYSRFQKSDGFQELLDSLGGGYDDAQKRVSIAATLDKKAAGAVQTGRATVAEKIREQIV